MARASSATEPQPTQRPVAVVPPRYPEMLLSAGVEGLVRFEVPIDAAGRASKKLVPHAILKVYEGAPHGITDTHKERLNADLLEFARS